MALNRAHTAAKAADVVVTVSLNASYSTLWTFGFYSHL